jgi:hypothetical protein
MYAVLILSVAFPQVSGSYPATSVGVVRAYCNFDLNTGRISSANFAKLPAYSTWGVEPGWDTVTIVSGFQIVSSKQTDDHAVVEVRWNVLGHMDGERANRDEKPELVDYHLKLVEKRWKIEAPVIPPHVSLPTMRAFLMAEFKNDPERQKSLMKSLDGLLEKDARELKRPD